MDLTFFLYLADERRAKRKGEFEEMPSKKKGRR